MNKEALLTALVEFGNSQQSIKYAYFASLAFALAEGLQCFPHEVTLIWASKWNSGKVLYLAARYIVFAELAVPGLYVLRSDLSVVTCRRLFAAGAVLNSVEVTAAEAIMFLRVYALGGTDRRLGAFLLAMFLGVHIGVYGFLLKFLNSILYTPSPLPTIVACLPTEANNHMLSIVFILLLVSELVILLITFGLCITKHKSTNSPLVATFSRDGLFYYVFVSAVSAGNIICNLAAPTGYIYLLTVPQMVLHSTLSTRMVLHIRRVGSGVFDTNGEVALTSLEKEHATQGQLLSMEFAAAPQSTNGGTGMLESGVAR
ncbi:hypothetical protein DFP72DRAFT_888184 [Ephemerocybe angulata]|uniref:DUF6533 domain-containing protein n=1 Tax=Ephemerocybe angulata TaxID=980116 RepID=A0A8H6I5A4_9AGAR|nr:hypothetical protein DFP72DRAFT_888184 [Tulosesus angulatus]